MKTWLIGVMLLAAPAGAEAQLGFVADNGSGAECQTAPSCGSDGDCEAGQICHPMMSSSGCAPPDALWCDPFGGPTPLCPSGMSYASAFGLQVCVPSDYTPCGADTAACFTSPPRPDGTGGGQIVAYRAGDCDRDGLRNDADPAPCQRPTTIGLVDPSTGACDAIVTRVCASDADCSSARPICAEVATVTTERHHYCVSTDPPALCCGGFGGAECVNGATCDADGLDAIGFCHPLCRDLGWTFEMRLQCLRDPSDPSRFVGPGAGDCDGDGVVNGEEERAEGRDPCVAEDAGVPMGPDGGPVVDDGGMEVEDAGAIEPLDGGATAMDGSTPPPVQPRFEGGGGCRCRASGGASTGSTAGPTAGSMAWLGFVAVALWRRRSRRAARRLSARRRPSAR